MLYIIYCKPDKKQGKKEFVKVLEQHFGVETIKKFTSKPAEASHDSNLIPVSEGSSAITSPSEFLDAVNKYESSVGTGVVYDADSLYTYGRQKDYEKYFYGISRDKIFEALSSDKHFALVCTNISIITTIKQAADIAGLLYDADGKLRMFVYCLVRQGKSDGSVPLGESLTIGEIKSLYEDSSEKTMPDWLKNVSDDTQAVLLPYGEARELDFFRYIAEFSNLLIVKDYGTSFSSRKHEYVKEVCEIIEKYIGLKKIQKRRDSVKKVFIIHPFGSIKFNVDAKYGKYDLIDDDNDTFKQQFAKMLFCCFGRKDKYELVFAQEVKNKANAVSGRSVELTNAILEKIKESDIIIGDLRNLNQNCIYEIGFAKGAKDNVYLVAPLQQMEIIKNLFFDTSTNTYEYYDIAALRNPDTAQALITKLSAHFGIELQFMFDREKRTSIMGALSSQSTDIEMFKETYEKIISN